METLKKANNFVSKNMALIVIAVAAVALFSPQTVSFFKTSYVNPLLGVVMFGMGLTLKPGDFKAVFSRPKDVIIGCIAQFTVMMLLAFGLTRLFGLSPELSIGVIFCGNLPRRDFLQCDDLSVQRRRALVCGNDLRIHHPGPVFDSVSHLRVRGSQG